MKKISNYLIIISVLFAFYNCDVSDSNSSKILPIDSKISGLAKEYVSERHKNNQARLEMRAHEAFERLFNHNRYSALKTVKHFAENNEFVGSISDLVSVANEGLLRAIKYYDPSKKLHLKTYSKFWVLSYLQRKTLKQKPERKFVIGDGAFNPTFDVDYENKELVKKLLTTLTPREHRVVTLYHGLHGSEPLSTREIGLILGISREQVRVNYNKAIDKLRKHSSVIHELMRTK